RRQLRAHEPGIDDESRPDQDNHDEEVLRHHHASGPMGNRPGHDHVSHDDHHEEESDPKYTDLGGRYSYHTSRSQFIMSQSLPQLRQEFLQVQNAAGVQMISGATYASQAFLQSLQPALLQVKKGWRSPGCPVCTASSTSSATALRGMSCSTQTSFLPPSQPFLSGPRPLSSQRQRGAGICDHPRRNWLNPRCSGRTRLRLIPVPALTRA
ncbi:MAG TPA: FMN-binding protein, partial [Gaiellaceae bacterium]|nr:FMN-binding protein [Gaiellaceae bacterium]